MDGFEATAAIRQAEQLNSKHMPIVAMTAHAMKGDRERCLAAGMDAYISKPIQFEQLLEVTESFSDPVTASTSQADKTWERDVALARVGGDETLLADLAKIFCEQSPRLLAAVQQAITKREVVDLKRAAHSLRSAIATFSAHEATNIAAQLEEFNSPEDFEVASELYQSLEFNVAMLRKALDAFAGKQPVETMSSPVHIR
jgi:CheY-like chemotaxis protein